MLSSLNASRLNNAHSLTQRKAVIAAPMFRGNNPAGTRTASLPTGDWFNPVTGLKLQINQTYGPFVVPISLIDSPRRGTFTPVQKNISQAISSLGDKAGMEGYSDVANLLKSMDSAGIYHGARPVKVEFIDDGATARVFITPLPQDQDEVFDEITRTGVVPESIGLPKH